MKCFLLLSIFLVSLNSSFAQKAGKIYVKGSITKASILDDLDSYKKIITQRHVDPFVCIKRREFCKRIEQIRDSADYFKLDEMLIRWLQLNAALRDGHTRIQYEHSVAETFPFYCSWFEEGIFIVGVTKENMAYQFCKVIAVNGFSVDELAGRIGTIVPDTTIAAIKIALPMYLSDPFIIHGLGISPSKNMAVYTLITPKGDTVQMHPLAIPKADVKIIIGTDTSDIFKPSELFVYRYVDSSNYIYFKYGSCKDDKRHLGRNMILEVEELIKKKSPQKIIVDLRDNGGGYKKS